MDPATAASLLDRLRRLLAPQYTIERELAAGGMGVVFLGTDVVLDRRVAIKVLRPELTSRAGSQRFTREARLLAKLQHPNIVAVHQAGETEGVRYFVMDYIDGRTLADRLTEGPLDRDGVSALARDLLSALEAAHRSGVVHRDVKPANVFLVGERALLGDFGIASAGDTGDTDDTTLTGVGQLIGTPAYMSPEQLAGGEASSRADLYSVGLVLYEACTGRRWAPATDPQQGDWRQVPPRLRRALRKALALSPASRWQDATTFRRALGRPFVPVLLPAALATVAAVVVGSIVGPCTRSDATTTARSDFAIVPFTRAGGDDSIGQRLARYVGNELEWFPGWRLTPVPASFAWAASVQPANRSLRAPSALGAKFYAEGELLGGSRTLRVSVRDSTGAPYYRLTVAGDPSDLLSWGSAIADSIVRIIFPQYQDEFRLAPPDSRNVQAYNELFAGQEAFRQDAWTDAQRHFELALELDPGFAQAAWQLAIVRRWSGRSFVTEWRRLYQQREHLPPLQRLIIAAQLDPDLPTRFGALQAAVRQYPRSTEGMLLEADELFHRGPLAGIGLDSALQAWEAASRRQRYFTATEHIAWGEITLGRQAAAHGALQVLQRTRDASAHEAKQRVRFIKLAYDARFRPWLGRLELGLLGWRADSALVAKLGQHARLALFFDIPDAQRRVGEILVRRGHEPSVRANGHEARGIALMAEGRPGAALAQLDSAAALFGTPDAEVERAEWRLLPAALGLPPADSASTAWARSALARASAGPHAVRAAWALAVDATNTGDSAALRRWRERLDAASRDTSSAGQLSRLIDGLVWARGGDPVAALAGTDSLLHSHAPALAQAPFARALLYLRRGEWLASTGKPEQADRSWLWYEASDVEGWPDRGIQPGEIDAVAGVFARLRRAELRAQRGDQAAACRYAARVRQLWAEAEPPYAALVGRADSLAAGCPD